MVPVHLSGALSIGATAAASRPAGVSVIDQRRSSRKPSIKRRGQSQNRRDKQTDGRSSSTQIERASESAAGFSAEPILAYVNTRLHFRSTPMAATTTAAAAATEVWPIQATLESCCPLDCPLRSRAQVFCPKCAARRVRTRKARASVLCPLRAAAAAAEKSQSFAIKRRNRTQQSTDLKQQQTQVKCLCVNSNRRSSRRRQQMSTAGRRRQRRRINH